MAQIRLFGNKEIVSFLEVIASTIIRDVSHQDPSDLRIRRRSVPLEDADVLELFSAKLEEQYMRIQKYWSITGRKPYPTYVPTVIHGDCRNLDTYASLSIEPNSIDLVVTSPPYATALPYIDTDRLSLMAIMGIPSNERTAYERELTGSREIGLTEKRKFEEVLFSKGATDYLPEKIVSALRHIHTTNQKNGAGFRRTNMATLLWRYFTDMKKNLENVHRALKPNASAFYVVGNSQTKLGEDWFEIQTCDYLSEVAKSIGFATENYLNISVTTEHMKHVKNAITENVILRFTKKAKR